MYFSNISRYDIPELIHEVGRSKQSDNASRQTVENQLRTTALESIRKDLKHIAGGRIHYEPTWNLEDSAISRLKNNILLLNKVGKLLGDEPELGRVMAMRKHVYVTVSKMDFPIDDICNAVERSNNLKKKARIVEGSRTRVEPDEAELLLKSGELILCIVGLYHLLKGWNGHGTSEILFQ